MAKSTPQNQNDWAGVDNASAQTGVTTASGKYQNVANSMQQSWGGFQSGISGFIQQSVTNATAQTQKQNQSINTQAIQELKADVYKSIQMVQANQVLNRTDLLAATTALKDFQEQQLLKRKREQDETQKQIARERREQQESLLEGVSKAVMGTARAVGDAFKKVTGLGLLDRLKKLLGLLAAGIVINNWETIWGGLQSLVTNWKRLAARFTSAVLKPVGRFFATILDFGSRIFRWGFEIVNTFRRVVGKALDFVGSLGKRLFSTLTGFINRVLSFGKKGFDSVLGRGAKNVARQTARSVAGSGTGSAATEAASSATRKGFWGNFSSSAMRGISSAAQSVDNTLFGGNVGKSANNAKQFVSEKLVQPVGSVFGPLIDQIKNLRGQVSNAFSAGGDTARNFITGPLSNFVQGGKSWFSGAAGTLDMLFAPFAGLIKKFGRGILQPLARDFGIGFPIDLLLNKYGLDQSWDEAFIRALGSGAGSLLGLIPIPGLGIAGAEIGDAIAGYLGGYNIEDNFANKLKNWLFGSSNSETSATTTDALGKSAPVDIKPTNNIVPANGLSAKSTGPDTLSVPSSITQKSTANTSFTQTNNSKFDFELKGNEYSTMTPNQILRNPRMDRGSASKTSGGGNVNIATTNLPAQSINVPGNTVNVGGGSNKGGGSVDNPVPVISTRNPLSDFYEIAAASIFGISLPV